MRCLEKTHWHSLMVCWAFKMGTPRLMTCGMVFFTILKSHRPHEINISKWTLWQIHFLRDAVDDGTHRDAHGAAGAVISDMGNVSVGVEGDGLVARVIARHVALAAVDAHILVLNNFIEVNKQKSDWNSRRWWGRPPVACCRDACRRQSWAALGLWRSSGSAPAATAAEPVGSASAGDRRTAGRLFSWFPTRGARAALGICQSTAIAKNDINKRKVL